MVVGSRAGGPAPGRTHLPRCVPPRPPDGLARTLVRAVDGLLHHAPAVAGVQRERVRELARLVDP
ncbi:hypothetical protein HX744_24035 [Pseudonocardia sp. ICBG1122]|nr:hypothetical protein [Pseudonocardia pini]